MNSRARPRVRFSGFRFVEPILHLSIPVRDLSESVGFYVESLGCELGRVREWFVDIWFFGMQVTLHERPEQILRCRLRERGVDRPSGHTATKAKILDPSGNVIELKAYVDPVAALGR
jgi:extradiol dioxygenase family protein